MSDLKCVSAGCEHEVEYIHAGFSCCQSHYQEATSQTLSAKVIYLTGLIIWVLIWACMYSLLQLDNPSMVKALNGYHDRESWMFVPFMMGFSVLAVNFFLWRKPQPVCPDYHTEVQVIEFVERNSSWFLIASGTFLTAASFFLTRQGTPPSPVIVTVFFFEAASLLSLFLVVLLYWIPYQRPPRDLVRLRHMKTIPFTYGVSFFAAAFLALVLPAIS